MLYRGLLTDVIDSLLKCCVFNVLQAIGVDMSTTRALEMCTKYVLNPFHIFLKVVSPQSGTLVFLSSPLMVDCNNVSFVTYRPRISVSTSSVHRICLKDIVCVKMIVGACNRAVTVVCVSKICVCNNHLLQIIITLHLLVRSNVTITLAVYKKFSHLPQVAE